MIVTETKISLVLPIFCTIIIFSKIGLTQNLSFGQVTVGDGLSNSYVNCLLQDKTGFIWFGTDDGLNRYDGYEIKIYRNNPKDLTSISNNVIWSLCEDHLGYLWVGTKGGRLNRYDPFHDRFDHWNIDSTTTGELTITYIFEDSNNFIWIGTYRDGLYRFDQKQNKFDHWKNDFNSPQIISENFIISILEDNYFNLWVSTYNGLNKFNPNSPQTPFTLISNDIYSVPIWYLGKSSFFENSIWVCKLDGLVRFSPGSTEYLKYNLPASPGLQFGNSVSALVEEDLNAEKILWIGTFGGLVRNNLTTGESERFIQTKQNPSGLISNQINDLIIDKSGVVWIATDNGLNFYSPKRAKFNFPISRNVLPLEIPEIQNGNIRAITQTINGNLWFGSERGLFGVENMTKNSTLIRRPELHSLNVWSLFRGNSNNLWIGTYGQGLKELDLKTNKVKTWQVANPVYNSPAFNYVKVIFQDDEGLLWIGFWGGGLARLNPLNNKIDYWRQEENKSESLSFNDVWAIHQDRKGRIWIGTNGGGLDLFNDKLPNSFYHWRADNKNKSGLSSNSIYSICESIKGNSSEDQTILWIGTANGLNKFIIKNDTGSTNISDLNVEINSYTVYDGLPDNSVESILEDKKGNLWIGTSSGISFFDNEKETFTNYGLTDGLNGNSFNSNSAIKTKDGIIFLGSTSGLNYFNPENIKQSNYSPPVAIIDFQIHNQPADVKNKPELNAGIFNSKNVELSYDQNDFSFQFASLDYNAPEMNQYAYMMEGFDAGWIYSGNRRFVTYTNLDPGEYIFRVKATNSDGVWNEEGATLTLIINPPFWATWWAYTIYVIIFLGALTFIRITEIKRSKKKEEERLRREREAALLREAKLKAITIEQEKELEKQKIRNRIAQDLHDEIGSNLSSISLMSDLIQNDEDINFKASEKIKRIHNVAKGSTQAIRDIVWLTNPSSDNFKDLVSKMNEVANDMLGGLKWNFDIHGELKELNLIPETKRNVFFIYKEALNNIVKHSGAENVFINLKTMNNKLILEISDDGKGFDTNARTNGNGLKNMQNRSKEIGGKLELKSNSAKGTKLVLEVNIT